MEKSNLVKGYIAYHKEVPYEIWNTEIWTPIQVGTDRNERITTYGGYYDNEGADNIAYWNIPFGELTAVWWIWKNLPKDCEYVLFTQYRRRFDIQTEEEVEEIFKQHKVAVASPANFGNGTLRTQFAACHSVVDIEEVEKIVNKLYPDYAEDFDRFINHGHEIYYSNGMCWKREDFCKYCEWLFSILFEMLSDRGWSTVEDIKKYVEAEINFGRRRNCDNKGTTANALNYQSQIPVFLSERLFTLYIKHNFKPEEVLKIPYTKLEKCF